MGWDLEGYGTLKQALKQAKNPNIYCIGGACFENLTEQFNASTIGPNYCTNFKGRLLI
jgi:hypothetical protein